MKVLIVSDLHLTARYDQRKFEFLRSLFKKTDRIILNGDFWSYHSCTFDEFVNSQWRFLFPILKRKKTIYIYGNHDLGKWSDRRVNLFSVKQTEKYSYIYKNKKFLIEHGNLATGPIIFEKEWFLKILRFFRWDDMLNQPFKILVPRFNIFRLTWGLTFGKKRIKRRIREGNGIVVMGHTHVPVYKPEKNYLNSGFINFGLAHYLWITNGEPRLVSTKY